MTGSIQILESPTEWNIESLLKAFKFEVDKVIIAYRKIINYY